MPGPRDDSWARVLDDEDDEPCADDAALPREGQEPPRLVDTAELEQQLKQIVALLPSAHQALRQLLGPKPPRNSIAQLNAARTVLDVAFQLWRVSAAAKAVPAPHGAQPKPGRVHDLDRAAAVLRQRKAVGA